MSFPILPDDVEVAHDAAAARQRDYHAQVAANVPRALLQARLISEYRAVAPHLPANAYLALAQAGADPYGPEITRLAQGYVQRPDSNVVRYLTSDGQGTIVQPVPRWDVANA